MTALVARQPLFPLSMSSAQRGPRRLSARLQEKDESQPNVNHRDARSGPSSKIGATTVTTMKTTTTNNRKRKNGYDEDDDGFQFSRVRTRKTRTSNSQAVAHADTVHPSNNQHHEGAQAQPASAEIEQQPGKKRKTKMSFSTPKAIEAKSSRRSKRLSDETQDEEVDGSPKRKGRRKDDEPTLDLHRSAPQRPQEKTPAVAQNETGDDHSATKIALPFADTPVIRRNKAMREGKGGKGERRSSLGLRGRRASSLIESGNSNALPHTEVEIPDFYKHIESEGLPEPKRMRQLLTWSATRAMGEKPSGTNFEDVSAKQAARVIQEELLKEISNKSEMSDWFGREDVQAPDMPIQIRPHPKNSQNDKKIEELEEQIKRLRTEKESLESFLQPPIVEPLPQTTPSLSAIETEFLSESDRRVWNSMQSSAALGKEVSIRINALTTQLQPTVDRFADAIHKMDQYRASADQLASRTLAICADKLSERDKEGRRRARQDEESRSPKRDLSSVLRSLAQAER